MRPRLIPLSLALVLPIGGLAAAASASETEERTLGNGLRVVVCSRPGSGVISCRLVLRGGSASDPPSLPGLSALMAELCDKGTARIGVRDPEKEPALRRNVEDVEDGLRLVRDEALRSFRRGEGPDPDDPLARPAALADLRKGLTAIAELHRRELVLEERRSLYARAGASECATWVEPDGTFFGVTLPAARLELFFWLESDRLAQAVLRDIAATRDRLRDERLESIENDAARTAVESFRSMLWAGHPYGARAPGSVSLDGVPRAELDREKARRLAPSNVVLILAGDLTAATAFDLASRYFGAMPSAPVPEDAPPRPPERIGVTRMESAALSPATVSFAWITAPAGHRDEAPLRVLAHAFSGGGGLLDPAGGAAAERPWSAGSARAEHGRFGGTFLLSVEAATNEELPADEAALRALLERVRTAPLDAPAVERARGLALREMRASISDLPSLATAIGRAVLCGLPASAPTSSAAIEAVTGEDLRRVAKTHLADAQRSALVLRRTRAAAFPPAPPVPPPASKPASAPASKPASAPAAAPVIPPEAALPTSAPAVAGDAASRPSTAAATSKPAAGQPSSEPTASRPSGPVGGGGS